MIEQALFNLQRGIPENKLYATINYTPESDLDRYVLSKVQAKHKYKMIIDTRNQEKYENQIAGSIVKKIDTLLSDILK